MLNTWRNMILNTELTIVVKERNMSAACLLEENRCEKIERRQLVDLLWRKIAISGKYRNLFSELNGIFV